MGLYRADMRRERSARADFIEGIANAVWGGKETQKTVKALRKR